MRTESEMVAYALEVDPALLPWISELLGDFDELGSDAAVIVDVLGKLGLPASARLVDLGCGKGAVAVAIVRAFGWRVEGIELFAPFVEACRDRADSAGVSDLCTFRHGDILKLAGRMAPVDVAVYAALSDVLGPLDETIGVIRRFVRDGGYMLICDDFIKDGGSAGFPGYENYAAHDETLRRLQAHGDRLRREVIVPADSQDAFTQDMVRIEQRAAALAARQPDLEAALARYVEDQRREYAFMAENVVPAVWVLERVA